VHAVVGVLSDDADPMVTVMKLEKAPQESYADIGGLDQQIQEIKVHVLYPHVLCCTCSLRSWQDLGAGERASEPPYSLLKPAREFTSCEAASEFPACHIS